MGSSVMNRVSRLYQRRYSQPRDETGRFAKDYTLWTRNDGATRWLHAFTVEPDAAWAEHAARIEAARS